jgi:hypothetical protein
VSDLNSVQDEDLIKVWLVIGFDDEFGYLGTYGGGTVTYDAR